MPVEIRVGSPGITINQGSTFMVTDTVEQLRGLDHRLQLATGRISAHLLDKLQDLPTIRLW